MRCMEDTAYGRQQARNQAGRQLAHTGKGAEDVDSMLIVYTIYFLPIFRRLYDAAM